MINKMSRSDVLVLYGLLIGSILFFITCIYGLVSFFIIRPEHNFEVAQLKSEVEVWHKRSVELDDLVRQCIDAGFILPPGECKDDGG